MSFVLSFRTFLPVVLVALGFAGCRPQQEQATADAVHVSGRIEGDEARIASKVPGRIAGVLVREGDPVTQGGELIRIASEQILARRDQGEAMVSAGARQLERARLQVPQLEDKVRQLKLRERQAEVEATGRVAQAEGALAAAKANLARSESEFAQADADAERFSRLAAKEAIPVQAAEQQRAKREALAAVVQAAKDQVAAAQGALEATQAAKHNAEILATERAAAEHQIEEAKSAIRAAASEVDAARAIAAQGEADAADLVIRAPFSGVVVTRAAEPGQVVAPGQTLLTIVDPKSLYLRAFVPEALISRVRVGQSAEVFLDAAPDRALKATVMRIDPQAMFTPENTYFRDERVRQVVGVKLLLSDGSGAAKLGMSAEGRILTGAAE
ncbi:MAG: efflux RND transporter periplasmic adaptor subunit [Bryobacterales bacterium]